MAFLKSFLQQPRSQKLLPFFQSFKVVYVLMVFVILYYLLIAADRYVSSITISVRSINNDIAPVSGLASLIGVNTGSREDVQFLKQYIHSLDMLHILDKEIQLKKLYESQKKDPFFMLFPNSSQESFLKFYQDRVQIALDETSGLLQVNVEGFSPQDAKMIAEAILKESERFVNEISQSAAREQMIFAEQELLKAKTRLQTAKNELLSFQSRYGVFDPLKQAEAKANLTTGIESKISEKETQLTTMRTYLNDNAPQIVMLNSEINALKKQLSKETSKIVASSNSKRLNDLAAKFQDLTIEAQFAQDTYTVALTSIETTRIESSRKIKHLVIIQNASEPQSPEYPKRLYNIVTIFVIMSMVYGIIKLIAMIIEEHRY
ncbi:capsule biosynthesis protein [Helicobacter sp. MIT 05-5294]|uniref:capsule biosynthesis protein n=1 Tax=Helicobacter sp. MIT 05-5294 TaxID=1548150 RepID=UPI00051FEE80|nr:capsule biosynthesis protein [Helicobacter sp. MIT 05-5294]TLD88090.1 capsule biosynthesis protein [Helicobacter sp. MIT 05-5294]